MKTAHATAPTPATPPAQAQAARGRAPDGPAADAFAQLLQAGLDGTAPGPETEGLTDELTDPATTQPPLDTAQAAGEEAPTDNPLAPFLALITPSVSSDAAPANATGQTPDAVATAPTGDAVLSDPDGEASSAQTLAGEAAAPSSAPAAPPSSAGARSRTAVAQAAGVAAQGPAGAPGPHWSRQLPEATAAQGQGLTAPGHAGLLDSLSRAWHMGAPGQPGGALADAPLPPAGWGAGGAALASADRAGTSAGTNAGGQGQAGQAPTSGLLAAEPGSAGPMADAGAEGPGFAASLGEAMGDAYETLGAQVSLWAAAQTKRASLRLDLGRAEALEVDVALDGDKTLLSFRTDDAQVREALQTQAPRVLAELLARAGLTLDGLSVGAQASGQPGQPGGDGRPGPWMALRATAEAAGPATSPAGPHHPNGHRGLSVYA